MGNIIKKLLILYCFFQILPWFWENLASLLLVLALVLFHCWEIAAENIVLYFCVYVHMYRVWPFQEAVLWKNSRD